MDSFYEYLLKSYVLFEEKSDLERFLDVYKAIKHFMRRGRRHCNHGDGPHPHYVNVNIESGDTFTQWVDSLQAAIPGSRIQDPACSWIQHAPDPVSWIWGPWSRMLDPGSRILDLVQGPGCWI